MKKKKNGCCFGEGKKIIFSSTIFIPQIFIIILFSRAEMNPHFIGYRNTETTKGGL